VANWYFWINADYFAPEAQRQPLLHLWSLGVEEQYYLVVPAAVLGLAVLARRNRGDLNLFGLAGTALVLVCALVAAAAFARSKPEADFFVTPLRAWEFAIGGAAILLLRRGLVLRQVPAHAGMTAGLLAIAAAVTIEATGPERRLLLQVLAAAGAGTVVLCGMFARGSAACRFLGLKPMVGLGIISYSLYL